MGVELIIPLFAIFCIFFIPITGIMLILTTRFALKPFVETLSGALRESKHGSSPELVSHLQALSEQVESLGNEVQQLRDAQEFDRKLLEAKTEEVRIPG